MDFTKEVKIMKELGDELGSKVTLTELFGEITELKKKIHLIKMIKLSSIVKKILDFAGVEENTIKELLITEGARFVNGEKNDIYFEIIPNNVTKENLKKINNAQKTINMEIQGLGVVNVNLFEDNCYDTESIHIAPSYNNLKNNILKATVKKEILCAYESKYLASELIEKEQNKINKIKKV